MISRSAGAVLAVLIPVTCIVGCTSDGPVTPSDPVLVPGVPSVNFTLWDGTVWAHGEKGVIPAPGIRLGGWLEQSSGSGGSIFVTADAHGRFQVALPEGARRIQLFSGEYVQPCAVTVEPGGRPPEVHLVVDPKQLGANLPAALQALQPTLSGVVFERTPEGSRPLADVLVALDGSAGVGGVPIARTVTDAEGRYVLCAVPNVPYLALFASAAGFPLFETSVDPARAVLDIELLRQAPSR
jgi:hypothetical protein